MHTVLLKLHIIIKHYLLHVAGPLAHHQGADKCVKALLVLFVIHGYIN